MPGQVALVEQRLAERARSGRRAAGAAPRPRPSPGRAGRGRGGRRRSSSASRAHQLDDAEREPDRRPARSVRSTTRASCAGRRQRLPGLVEVPGALHLQVGVQGRRSVVDPGEQVLAAGRRSRRRSPPGGRRSPARAPGSRCGQHLRRSAPGRACCAVRQTVSPSGTRQPRSRSPRGVGDEAGRLQRLRAAGVGAAAEDAARRRPSRRSAGPARPARTAVGRARRIAGGERVGVVGEGEQGPAAALDVQRQLAVDQHHERAGLAAGPVARRGCRRRSAGRARAARRRRGWPGRSRPARRRAGLSSAVARVAGERAQPVDRAGRRRTGRRRAPLDEVAAPAAAGLLERGQHLVDAGEAAGHALAHHRAAGDHAVPLEQPLGRGVRAPGRVGLELGQQRPAAGGRRRPGAGRQVGAAAAAARASGRAAAAGGCGGRCGRREVSARSGARVSLVSRPAQTRSHSAAVERLVVGGADGGRRAAGRSSAPPPASASSDGLVQSAVASSSAAVGQRQAGACRRGAATTQPSVPGSVAVAGPEHLAGGGELVEHRRAA